MPKRTDIHSILVIGSGPIVIGQACEFDYSGTQACRVLKEEGYRVILANSNPATIMTDPDFADATYIEPLDPDVIESIIARERPDALLPTLGGQTALNLAMELDRRGVLAKYGVEMIGANALAIETAENRERFKEAMQGIGIAVPQSSFAHNIDQAMAVAAEIGWGRVMPKGRGLGLACHFTFGGYAAHAIEVRVSGKGELTIERIVCAVDVGRPINPLGIEAQMQGGTIDGLSAALLQAITVRDGRIVESGFNDYPILPLSQTPTIDVHIIASTVDPKGCGEMGIPTVAPALANAIFNACGVRLRRLPIKDQLRRALAT